MPLALRVFASKASLIVLLVLTQGREAARQLEHVSKFVDGAAGRTRYANVAAWVEKAAARIHLAKHNVRGTLVCCVGDMEVTDAGTLSDN